MINWIKNNRIASALILLVAVYIFNNFFGFSNPFAYRLNNYSTKSYNTDVVEMAAPSSFGMAADSMGSSFMRAPIMPESYMEDVSLSSERVVIQNSSMSLLVSDVRETGDQIIKYAENSGGFMVNADYNRPDESAFGTITVRVPTNRLNEALETFRNYSVKVTSESLNGRDVTEQYTDIEARLETLEKTKSKFETILDQAVEIDDILRVNKEIINLQTQIDNLIGQREAIENNASLTKITIFLSTDELSLPYAPDNKFRPGVTFKLATRGMLSSLVWIAERSIWLAVYSIIWVPALLFFWIARKYYLSNKK